MNPQWDDLRNRWKETGGTWRIHASFTFEARSFDAGEYACAQDKGRETN
jgi:hypothetical protein